MLAQGEIPQIDPEFTLSNAEEEKQHLLIAGYSGKVAGKETDIPEDILNLCLHFYQIDAVLDNVHSTFTFSNPRDELIWEQNENGTEIRVEPKPYYYELYISPALILETEYFQERGARKLEWDIQIDWIAARLQPTNRDIAIEFGLESEGKANRSDWYHCETPHAVIGWTARNSEQEQIGCHTFRRCPTESFSRIVSMTRDSMRMKRDHKMLTVYLQCCSTNYQLSVQWKCGERRKLIEWDGADIKDRKRLVLSFANVSEIKMRRFVNRPCRGWKRKPERKGKDRCNAPKRKRMRK